ncbi:reverse transcriptase-like protein [Patescibacteria group bacterium]|jgi:ribonuclease HI|nr:reverse transcriptase-like protein [Patescibacteria group bacterium]
MRTVYLYTDGGARGNPGPAGIGVQIVEDGEVKGELAKYLAHQTNNVAEYQALIHGLELLIQTYGAALAECNVIVRMDSELIVRQLTHVYRVKDPTLKTLFARVEELRQQVPHLTLSHVSREENAEADRLANEAMDTGA